MNLRQVRTKIKSINNVKKITKAMQLVSAVKMKKAQQLAIEGNPYRHYLDVMLKKVARGVDLSSMHFLKPAKESTKELVIVISSSKGLCGSFNMNLFRTLAKTVDIKNVDFITLGSKGASFLPRVGGNVVADYSVSQPIIQVSALFDLVLKKYLSGEYGKISLFYNKFISTLRSEPTHDVLLPLTHKVLKETKDDSHEYTIEPSATELMEQLFKSYLEEKIRGAVINSEASEHSQRMIAMKNATDNASDVIYNLTLVGNKLRQEKITGELLDMITAKESVDVG